MLNDPELTQSIKINLRILVKWESDKKREDKSAGDM